VDDESEREEEILVTSVLGSRFVSRHTAPRVHRWEKSASAKKEKTTHEPHLQIKRAGEDKEEGSTQRKGEKKYLKHRSVERGGRVGLFATNRPQMARAEAECGEI